MAKRKSPRGSPRFEYSPSLNHRYVMDHTKQELAYAMEQAGEKIAAKVKIKLDAKDITEEKVARIRSICTKHKGKSPVYVTLRTDKGTVRAVAGEGLKVRPDVDFCKKMEQLVGVENFELTR